MPECVESVEKIDWGLRGKMPPRRSVCSWEWGTGFVAGQRERGAGFIESLRWWGVFRLAPCPASWFQSPQRKSLTAIRALFRPPIAIVVSSGR